MRLRIYSCAAAVSLLAVAGCDRTPHADNVATATETAAPAAADAPRHHAPDPVNPVRDGRTPAWITAKIQSQYYLDPELKPWRIDVDTSSSGAVTLSGTVDSDEDRGEAVKIARATEGVTAVNDNLRVQPQGVATTGTLKDTTDVKNDAPAITDSWITMKIQSKFFLDDDARARNIDVDTKHGVVTLKGSVESEGERLHALAIARSTDGVTMVHDSLAVDPANSGKQSPDHVIDDAWITMKIQSKYFIHDEIKSRKVDVDTRKGVVTLNGSVPSDTAKGAAEVIAKDTDGVSRVINHLKVEPN